MRRTASIVIVGAGLQGSGIALELARRGHRVTLLDRDARPLNRASRRNEGKIHLGLIYAADPSLATAEVQLRGALLFQSLLARWCGEGATKLPLSTPFEYLVDRDSLLGPSQLEDHYERLDALYRSLIKTEPTLSYLGTQPDRLYERRSEEWVRAWFAPERFQAVFRTAELAIDTDAMATLVEGAIRENERITFMAGRRVETISRESTGFRIEGSGPAGRWSLEADQVVNATWENRFVIDASLGIAPTPGWLHRLKYRVIVSLPQPLRGAPSATMVLGRYGDVVVRPDGTAYLSWYPTSLRGWTHDLAPPDDWDRPCRGEADPVTAAEIARLALSNIGAWYPGIRGSEPIVIDAGAIVAYGDTDVDDSKSGLHDRTRIGVRSFDGYHSVDPGKLTTAPLFAIAAADAILGRAEQAA